SNVMHGVNVSKPAGQAYYDSIARLYAGWGVDYIKADDMSRAQDPKGENYHGPEIEALRKAMNKTGRPMVLSLSPGPTQLANAASVTRWSQLWRISDDMWDNWNQVKKQFDYCRDWARYSGAGRWPDTDMLPLGRLCVRGFKDGPRTSRLTHAEQITLMTLWSIFRSPLMMGGDLPASDPFTLSLLTNADVIAVDQGSTGEHELFRDGDKIAWISSTADGLYRYIALFNTGDQPAQVTVSKQQIGLGTKYYTVLDLWKHKSLGELGGSLSVTLNPHAAGLYKLIPVAGMPGGSKGSAAGLRLAAYPESFQPFWSSPDAAHDPDGTLRCPPEDQWNHADANLASACPDSQAGHTRRVKKRHFWALSR
ncbi:MAG: glycoside hydrolase family 27 protein, partial [Terriglobia bacterium]